jgi:hypothetical protein
LGDKLITVKDISIPAHSIEGPLGSIIGMISTITNKKQAVTFLIGLASLIFVSPSAWAQFVPGGYYRPDMGVVGSVTSAYSTAQSQRAYTQDRQMQMAGTMAKSAAWQGINRSMQSEAASRSGPVPDAGQAARDWMYQNAPSGRSRGRPMTLPATQMASASSESSGMQGPREIMLWPTLLKEQRFRTDRYAVEAPFRRAYADGTPMTIDDYEGIINGVENLKAQVKTMESQLVETEYNSVQKYLDDLIADAEKRIRAREK